MDACKYTHRLDGEVDRVTGSYSLDEGRSPNVMSNHEPNPWSVPTCTCTHTHRIMALTRFSDFEAEIRLVALYEMDYC